MIISYILHAYGCRSPPFCGEDGRALLGLGRRGVRALHGLALEHGRDLWVVSIKLARARHDVGLAAVRAGEEFGGEALLGRRSFLGIDLEARAYEVLGVLCDVHPELVRRERVLAALDRLALLGGRVAVERREAAQQQVRDDAQRPHVDGPSVALLREDLRRHVRRRAHGGCEQPQVVAVDDFAEPEVADEQTRRGAACFEQQVFWLEVAVHDAVGVQVGDAGRDLLHELGRVGFVQGPARVDAVEQLAALGELGHEVQAVLRFEVVDEREHVRLALADALEHGYLVFHEALAAPHNGFADDLCCKPLARFDVADLVHHRERADAELAAQMVQARRRLEHRKGRAVICRRIRGPRLRAGGRARRAGRAGRARLGRLLGGRRRLLEPDHARVGPVALGRNGRILDNAGHSAHPNGWFTGVALIKGLRDRGYNYLCGVGQSSVGPTAWVKGGGAPCTARPPWPRQPFANLNGRSLV